MSHLPLYDPDLALSLASGEAGIAHDLLSGLLNTLPHEIRKIETAFQSKDQELLLHLVHKLHGLICYCGLPRLKAAAADLENTLKEMKKLNQLLPEKMDEKLSRFFAECDAMLSAVRLNSK